MKPFSVLRIRSSDRPPHESFGVSGTINRKRKIKRERGSEKKSIQCKEEEEEEGGYL